MTYQFEWDGLKNLKNWWKHGIWFWEAAAVFDRDDWLLKQAKTVDAEPRFILIGRHENRIIAIIFTFRCKKIRIISARAARREERKAHDEANNRGGIRPQI